MKNQWLIRPLTASLMLLFVYTALSKLSDYEGFGRQLAKQPVPDWSVATLQWAIPATELAIVLLLFRAKNRLAGLYGSAALMLVFTGYMGLVLLNFFDRVPCSCGGVLRTMDFKEHFFFNLFFLLLSVCGIWLEKGLQNGVKAK